MILLLTGCINPEGMILTKLIDKEERKKQYCKAIHYYLKNTKYPIVFSENSGSDISPLFRDEIDSGRFECLTFKGNKDKKRGKGYGECEIIEYALKNSRFIQAEKNKRIAKITGRLIIKNLKNILIHSLIFPDNSVLFAINSDISFPDSRLIIAHVDFYRLFIQSKNNINDISGYYFEHALYDTIKREKRFIYVPFFIMPRIEGISGSTGRHYNTERKSLTFTFRYIKRSLSQLLRFRVLYR